MSKINYNLMSYTQTTTTGLDIFLAGAKIRFRAHPFQSQETIERINVGIGGKSALNSDNFVTGYYDTEVPSNWQANVEKTADEIAEAC
ncbi:hypothetical protein KDA23_05530 [Candidatus Saccharibacteria bacterium]|nr:hypothetical protein [Candidatus Saccharibacteria bacterium]